MNRNGGADLVVRARRALLDALDALAEHQHAVVVIGAQAIYLHTDAAPVALAEFTKDSDLALDSRILGSRPLLEQAMTAAGFRLDPDSNQPGAWMSPDGIPVDLMVPEALAGVSGRRAVRIPPHSKRSARRVTGIEAAVVDHRAMRITALASDDDRVRVANVASPAALLVAKLHKLGEREGSPGRLENKDAHDIYRLLVAVPTQTLTSSINLLHHDGLAGPVTQQALCYLQRLFAAGADALGSVMAGRAEKGIGDPEVVAASAAALSKDLLSALRGSES